ncbi:MAG TPA: DUF2628 domain-containing protein [Aestuariivirga sp.]|nr:DUF2628 domain-containing protein [Aestuariivirga sp.]
MAIYSVHSRPGAPAEDSIFVKEGFAWAAFFFTLLWALWHRMWIVAAVAFSATAAIAAAASWLALGDLTVNLASLAVSLILGFEGNDLRRWSLARRGCREIGMAAGRDLGEAELRFFAALAPGRYSEASPAPPKLRPEGHDPLGLFGTAG